MTARVSNPTYRDGLIDGGEAAANLATRLAKAIDGLRAEAFLLDQWAQESASGGWSTHQVDPMRRKATQLRTLADELERP